MRGKSKLFSSGFPLPSPVYNLKGSCGGLGCKPENAGDSYEAIPELKRGEIYVSYEGDTRTEQRGVLCRLHGVLYGGSR